jgi:Bifunctional DNA primase/polymerase, N-terminal
MTAAEIAPVLDSALALGAEGRNCFPCTANKRPTTPRGFHDAASDPTVLRTLWRQYPASLVGVATSAVSKVDVLDLDRKHPEAAEWWSRNRDKLPDTQAHRTRSGGLKPALASIEASCAYMGGVSRAKFYADILPQLETVKLGRRNIVVTASMDRLIEATRRPGE